MALWQPSQLRQWMCWLYVSPALVSASHCNHKGCILASEHQRLNGAREERLAELDRVLEQPATRATSAELNSTLEELNVTDGMYTHVVFAPWVDGTITSGFVLLT